ncbi:MAG: hypothetical protein OER12_04325 [Acidimicrobiia bacterium]|nr:hypothetical protein [Acidimicrobiia bacterium]
MRKITTLIAIALIAAACGGDGETASTLETLEGASSDTMPPITTDDAGTTGTTAASEGPVALPESDYPDVVVADLAGGEINLKELALETEPVLLWFWAPH